MIRSRRYPRDEIARRGEEIFERDIRPRVASEDPDKFVLIDIKTGAYEIDPDETAASDRLRKRVPDAEIWMRKVGSRSSRKYGYRVQIGKS